MVEIATHDTHTIKAGSQAVPMIDVRLECIIEQQEDSSFEFACIIRVTQDFIQLPSHTQIEQCRTPKTAKPVKSSM
jgi:hypothetical protein